MGVYIDIEMPECCADCAFFVQLAGSDVTECVISEGRVGQWCPLEDADRKTEPTTEDCSTVDKDINVPYKIASDQRDYDSTYEPTYNEQDGSM